MVNILIIVLSPWKPLNITYNINLYHRCHQSMMLSKASCCSWQVLSWQGIRGNPGDVWSYLTVAPHVVILTLSRTVSHTSLCLIFSQIIRHISKKDPNYIMLGYHYRSVMCIQAIICKPFYVWPSLTNSVLYGASLGTVKNTKIIVWPGQ